MSPGGADRVGGPPRGDGSADWAYPHLGIDPRARVDARRRATSDKQRTRTFGGYEIVEFLGRSGGTRVYRARQITMGRSVRLSILPPDEAKKASHRQAFDREVRVASQLRHDHVLGAIDAGSLRGHQYVVTEDVQGGSLADLLAEGKRFGVSASLRIARHLASALEHFEKNGFVHRHVSPHNVLVGPTGVAKLAGFSRAKKHVAGAGETWFDADPSEAPYRAPEFVRGKSTIDVRADLYAVGCILYELLTGRPPYAGVNAAMVLASHVEKPVPDPRARDTSIPEPAAIVTQNCMQKSRADRYQHAAELVADLERAAAGQPVAALPLAAPKGRPLGKRLRRLWK